MAARIGLDVKDAPPAPDGFVVDNQDVEVAGLKLRVLATPGHTQGSVSYYTDRMLFSGDTLFRASIGRTDMPGGSLEQELTSICERLLVLPDETVVLPGHMEQTTIGFERQHNPYIQQWLKSRVG